MKRRGDNVDKDDIDKNGAPIKTIFRLSPSRYEKKQKSTMKCSYIKFICKCYLLNLDLSCDYALRSFKKKNCYLIIFNHACSNH
ncbi:hypothetical protein RclHR1_06020005 [Rhizophagus clarus]|uniref:Uncharacterized protein n=1 Tax=Rhizophagus clarus TaxID=94130 RepID=A0A2Z6S755_9GLOM|nr:hypothetical protein RclHR1_06020005 [Rhizophagus clarus]GET04014.1 hypothetical protein RCL_jg24343.t1 [Rhizophagus clarus]